MDLQSKFETLLTSIPDTLPLTPTFMEIAGFPHYENVCSNILKFYLNPKNKLHGLQDLVLNALLVAADCYCYPFTETYELEIKREVVTDSGRIDLVLISNKWVIGIENKIYHFLKNDLNEYASFLKKEFPGLESRNIVLSIREEGGKIQGGFVNVTYKRFVQQLEIELINYKGDRTDQYFIFFTNFLQTIKNLYMPINLERPDIEFLINNQEKIDQLVQMEQKLVSYINQRANAISNAIAIEEGYKKWVYEGYDVGFHYNFGDTWYKLECRIDRNGISIVVCVEQNKVDKEALKKLELFKENDIETFSIEGVNKRVILEQGIDFFIPDEELIKKLKLYLAKFKIAEPNEQLN